MSLPQTTGVGQALSWAGSAMAAAAVVSGVAALLAATPPPGQSRGQTVAPIVLTLAPPDAVTALPTPLPEVSSTLPAPPALQDTAIPQPGVVQEMPVTPSAAPSLPTMSAAAEAPLQADPTPPLPEAKPVTAKPAAKPAKPKAESPDAAPVAGDAGTSAKSTRNDGAKAGNAQAKAAQKRWASEIRKRIEARKAYPAAAAGQEGTVTVRLTVSRTGQLLGVAVVTSSGSAALDGAAVRAVQSARFPAAPDGMPGDSASFSLPMKFAK